MTTGVSKRPTLDPFRWSRSLSMHPPRGWNKKGIETILAALLMVVIVVAASVMIYSWSTGLLQGIVPPPPNGRENLIVENQGFDSTNKNMTLYLRNTGSAQTTLISYYVNDFNGDQYGNTTWKGPTIPQTNLGKAYLLINSKCTGCKLIGSAFTFQPGNSYTVTLVTSRNAQFSFTIPR